MIIKMGFLELNILKNSILDLYKLSKMNISGAIVSSILMNKKTNNYLIKKRASR